MSMLHNIALFVQLGGRPGSGAWLATAQHWESTQTVASEQATAREAASQH